MADGRRSTLASAARCRALAGVLVATGPAITARGRCILPRIAVPRGGGCRSVLLSRCGRTGAGWRAHGRRFRRAVGRGRPGHGARPGGARTPRPARAAARRTGARSRARRRRGGGARRGAAAGRGRRRDARGRRAAGEPAAAALGRAADDPVAARAAADRLVAVLSRLSPASAHCTAGRAAARRLRHRGAGARGRAAVARRHRARRRALCRHCHAVAGRLLHGTAVVAATMRARCAHSSTAAPPPRWCLVANVAAQRRAVLPRERARALARRDA